MGLLASEEQCRTLLEDFIAREQVRLKKESSDLRAKAAAVALLVAVAVSAVLLAELSEPMCPQAGMALEISNYETMFLVVALLVLWLLQLCPLCGVLEEVA